MAKSLSVDQLMTVLDKTYELALNGIPGMDTVEELAQDYLDGEGTIADKVNRLIRFQNAKTFTSGFVTGLGDLITLPVAIPLNISSVLYVQVRMIAAIAHMGGHDIRKDQVKAMVFVCVCGNEAKDILKSAGIQVGRKLAEEGIKKIPRELIKVINRKVGFRLLAKFGEKAWITLGKLIPVIGGIIGGTFDLVATNIVGNVARNTFIADKSNLEQLQ
jgi:hypothetical protein